MTDTQTPQGGIVGNTREGAARATSARVATKKDWHKSPMLHVGMAIGVILIGIILVKSFQFNLFSKLLLGVVLLWGGGKLRRTSIGAFTTWGNILKGIAGIIIALALLQSGLRVFGEGAVTWLDSTLRNAIPAEGTGSDYPAQKRSSKPVQVNLAKDNVVTIHNVDPDTKFEVVLPGANDRKEGVGMAYWGCPRVIEPKKTIEPIYFNVVGQDQRSVNYSQITDAGQGLLREQGAKSVSVEYTRKLAHTSANPCSFLKY